MTSTTISQVYKCLSLARKMAAEQGIAWQQGGGGKTKGKLGGDVKALMAIVLPASGLEIIPGEVTIVETVERKTASGAVMVHQTITQKFIVASTIDGSFVVGASAGTGVDIGDKYTQKACTYAWKSFVLNLLSIPDSPVIDTTGDTITPEQAAILHNEVGSRVVDTGILKNYLLDRFGATSIEAVRSDDYLTLLSQIQTKPLK